MKSLNEGLSRRNFIRLSGISGVALTIGLYCPAWAQDSETVIGAEAAENMGLELTAWVSIDKTGKVTILNHRAEMGQGSFQAVPQMIAEELEVDLNDINILFAPGSQTKFGPQVTGGSSTVSEGYKRLLRTGATAREMLIEAALKLLR